jgi:hypothetical protein
MLQSRRGDIRCIRFKAKVLASIATFGIILGMALMGMALKGYKSNNNVVYSSKCYVDWTPKYRRSALLGPIAKRCPSWRFIAYIAARVSPTKISAAHVVDEQLFGFHGGWGSARGLKTKWRNQKNV